MSSEVRLVSGICGLQWICSCLSTLSHSRSSDRKEAGLSLCDRSVLVSAAAISRVVALAGQADVTVVAVGSGTATLVEFSTNWWKGFSVLRRCRTWLAITKGRARTVLRKMSSGLAVGARPTLLLCIAGGKAF